MSLAQRHREPVEAHFTEGELDLEPPEELAIAELDEEAILEEELDNEDLLEEDVDEDTLEATLEHLVHGDDGDLDDDGFEAAVEVRRAPTAADLDGSDDFEQSPADGDVEESLDLVLAERLALVGPDGNSDGDGEGEITELEAVLLLMTTDGVDPVDVAPCGSGEFVCRSCFLVRRRVQLVDAVAMVCGDCST